MPMLGNPRHEEYARLLAQGLTQKKAYVQAGYNQNAAAASKLATSIPIKRRVQEIKTEIAEGIQKAMTDPTVENCESLADMGLTMEWVAAQYKQIYSQALESGQFAPANTAVQNIQKLIELENEAKKEDDRPKSSLVSVEEMSGLLTDMKGLFEAKATSDKPPILEAPEDVMKDITPDE